MLCKVFSQEREWMIGMVNLPIHRAIILNRHPMFRAGLVDQVFQLVRDGQEFVSIQPVHVTPAEIHTREIADDLTEESFVELIHDVCGVVS